MASTLPLQPRNRLDRLPMQPRNRFGRRCYPDSVFHPEVWEIESSVFRDKDHSFVRFVWRRIGNDVWEFQDHLAVKMTTDELRALFERGIFNPTYTSKTYPPEELARVLGVG
jgi:hypothetical protein